MPTIKTIGTVAALAILLLLAGPASAPAGEAVPMPGKVFDVSLTDASGTSREAFDLGDDVVFNVRFGLMLSDIRSYPVAVTITVGPDTKEAYSGRLDEGFWLVREKARVTSGWGRTVPWKVVLKVKMTNRAEGGGSSYYAYYKTEGSFSVR